MTLQSLVKTVFYRLGYNVKKLAPASASARSSAGPGTSNGSDLMTLLHKESPYEGFAWQEYPEDEHGWGSSSPAFASLIAELRPRFIIEVGTWKGGSALEMARVLEAENLPESRILCIDTWLGALEFWTDHGDPERYGSLRLQHGYPTVYYQFLANVCRHQRQSVIIPFPQTSVIGSLWLRRFGIQAPMIYIDGSHEEEDVYADVLNYWESVEAGGVLFGDDWGWDGVRLAVQRFARENRLPISHLEDKWILRKSR